MAIQRLEEQSNLEADMYETAYDSAIQRIEDLPRIRRNRAFEALAWVTYSQRPLTPRELELALAIGLDDDTHDVYEEDIVPYGKVISHCAGLITEDAETGSVRLVHFTAQEYLERKLAKKLPEGPELEIFTLIATKCLRYLSFETYTADTSKKDDLDETLARYPFLEYAATYWGFHFRQFEDRNRRQQDTHRMAELAVSVLSCPDKVYNLGQIVLATEYRYRFNHYWETLQPSHSLAFLGLRTVLDRILDTDSDLNATTLGGQTLLLLAAKAGHEDVVRLLLHVNNQVNINARGLEQKTPLIWAAQNGHEAVVRVLLAADEIDVNATESFGGTSLHWAARSGQEAIVRTLLTADQIDVNAADFGGATPLHRAAEYGHEAIVQMLLEAEQIEVHPIDRLSRTPLSSAAVYGHEAIVKMLLKAHEAVLNPAQPINTARAGYEANKELLLPENHVNGRGRPFSANKAFLVAAMNGHRAIMELLLDTQEIDINYVEPFSGTPLAEAAAMGHEEIVKMLLALDGIEVNSVGESGESPLFIAAKEGHEAIVRLLFETKKADVNLPDSSGRTPLSYAVENGHAAIVRLLLATNRVNVNSQNKESGKTPLLLAASNGNAEVVELLLGTKQVDVSFRDADGNTAFMLASHGEHHEVADLLLRADDQLDIDACNSDGRPPLCILQ